MTRLPAATRGVLTIVVMVTIQLTLEKIRRTHAGSQALPEPDQARPPERRRWPSPATRRHPPARRSAGCNLRWVSPSQFLLSSLISSSPFPMARSRAPAWAPHTPHTQQPAGARMSAAACRRRQGAPTTVAAARAPRGLRRRPSARPRRATTSSTALFGNLRWVIRSWSSVLLN